MINGDDSLIKDFVYESRDMLDDAELRLIEMQKGSSGTADPEIINAVFRLFHSIKGSAGFLHFNNISAVSHETETLLDLFRKGKAAFTQIHTDLMCQTCDFIRRILEKIETELSDSGMESETQQLVKILAESVAAAKAQPLLSSSAQPPAFASQQLAQPASAAQETKPAPIQPAAPALQQPQSTPELSATEPAPVANLSSMQMVITPEMRRLFIQDATDILEEAEQTLINLSKKPANPQGLVNDIFRSIHTFKGNCGFFGFPDFETLSHSAENVLDLMRDNKIETSDLNIQIMLNIVDILQSGIASLAKDGNAAIQGLDAMLQLLDEMLPEGMALKPAQQPPAPTQQPAAAPETPSTPPVAAPPPQQAASAATPAKTAVRQDIRVDVDKLDHLHNLVGEMVIASAMVTMNSDLQGLRLENFSRAAHQLMLIVSELQDISMSMRMIPIAATFRKMIRLCHDLGMRSGKKVETRLVGEETEVDKGVAELIADPLVHLVRNSVDHGLEPPEERLRAGKPEIGTITLEAKHQSGEIWIAIKDDGRGLNRSKIIAKAQERGLIRGDPAAMNDSDVFNLIFEPGFSTSEKITDVSGRGVGMDVVRKNIEKLRGRVDVENHDARGLTVYLRIPLTLAIIQGMLVRIGAETYIVPLLAIRESFRALPGAISTVSGRGEMIHVRGELLPFFRLARLYNVPNAETDQHKGITIILEDGHHLAAVLVDEIIGQQEIVIKKLGEVFGAVPGISGSSILSDGHVGLILDVAGVVRLATGQG